ncbi:MAG: VOC family protein [Saprospiraceae bacterium]
MKSNFLGLRTAIYKVSNLEEAKNWYSRVFDTQAYFDEPFYVGFSIKGFELGLLPEDGPSPEKGDSVLTYWGVDDVESCYAQLLTLGATEHEAPQNVGGDIVVATVKDPWNNILGIIFNPTFSIDSD